MTFKLPTKTALQRNELKNLLNQRTKGKQAAYISQLASGLSTFCKLTEKEAVSRGELGYQLDRGTREKALASESSRKDEDRLEATIHKKWMPPKNPLIPFLLGAKDKKSIVDYIPSSQIPLFNKRGMGNWGYIDLVGCAADSPVVIELKIKRFSKSAQPETPLRALIEGLAYAISLKDSWEVFGPEWRKTVGIKSRKSAPKSFPVVVLGTDDYWEAVRGCDFYPETHEKMPELTEAMRSIGFPSYFASIAAECDVDDRREWTLTGNGKAKEIFL